MGDYFYGVKDCVIAAWQSTGTYDDEVQVDAIRVLSITDIVESSDLEGDDTIVATISKRTGATIEVEFGLKNLTAFAELSGGTLTSGTNDKKLLLDAAGFPYIGVAAYAHNADEDGAIEFFVPKCKPTGQLQVTIQNKQWSIVRTSLKAVADGAQGIYQFMERASVPTLQLPPAVLS